MRPFALLAVTAGVCAVSSFGARAQAPADAAPHSNFTGTWTLNRTLSDDPLEARFDRPQTFGNQGAPPTRGYGGRSGFGGRRGGFGGSRPSGDSGATATIRTPTASELIHEAKTASASLVIAHNDPSFVVTDAIGHTWLFQTNGTTDTHQLVSGTVQSVTRWAGERLTTAYDLGDGEQLIYTYTLVPQTRQLVVRISLQRSVRETNSPPPTVKLVYDAARGHAEP